MRIALLTETFPPNLDGVSHMTAKLAKELSREHEVLVVTLSDEESVESNGMTVHRLKGTTLNAYPQQKYRVRPPYKKVMEILGKFGPDVIHTQTSLTLGAAGKHAGRKMKLPVVSTFHTDLEDFAVEIVKQGNLKINPLTRAALSSRLGKKVALKLIDRAAYPLIYSYFTTVDAVTSPSDSITERLMENGVSPERIWKVPNPIEVNPESMPGREFRKKWGVEGFMVLHVGRLSWEKRIDKILETAARIPEATFVITSEGPLGNHLKGMAARLGLKNVIFTDYLPYRELYGAYKACDCFLAASPYETFNISAAQSLAFGKPVVGVKRMGLTEFIDHGLNGFLVDPDDREVDRYEGYLRLLMKEDGLRRGMGRESRHKARKFEKKKIVKKFVDVYENVETNGFCKWKYARHLTAMLAFARLTRL